MASGGDALSEPGGGGGTSRSRIEPSIDAGVGERLRLVENLPAAQLHDEIVDARSSSG